MRNNPYESAISIKYISMSTYRVYIETLSKWDEIYERKEEKGNWLIVFDSYNFFYDYPSQHLGN